jgi:protein phosphatase
MVITCPNCGALTHDPEFCDHCNADLAPPAASPPPAQCAVTADLSLALTPQQLAQLVRPEAAVVVRGQRHAWRLHWIAEDAWPKWEAGVTQRCAVAHATLAPCRWQADTGGVWVIAEASGRAAHPWLHSVAGDPVAELRRLLGHLEQLAATLHALRAAGWQWLTFEPRALEHAPGTRHRAAPEHLLRITNLDLRLFALGEGPAEVPFSPRYVAPEVCRFNAAALGPATDVFHLGMVAYYWIARLLPGGFLGRGLEAFGHRLPPLRIFAPALPPGVATMLDRALALPPDDRFATPEELCAALREAIDRAGERQTSTTPVAWEIGAHTRTGRTKQALGRSNEDAVVARAFADPPRALVAVADGITTCEVGSGGLASLLTCLALENTFDADSSARNFVARMNQACLRAAENLLAWAFERGHGRQLEMGAELMGTTLTAGWLEDNRLHLANLGDSRAYLIGPGFIEQLTVDGDLGTSLLASGAAPEHLLELGALARALRVCVGGCDRAEDGRVVLAEQHNRPTFSRWTLLPGDVIVLCTDGLVEEGAYLEPTEVEQMVRRLADRPIQELADLLAAAAEDRQQLPSPWEPEGRGDNISCVAIRVVAREDSASQAPDAPPAQQQEQGQGP